MSEKLKKSSVQKLIKEINNNEFLETGDLFVRSNKDIENILQTSGTKQLPALYTIYRKAKKGATVVISNQTLRECYCFLQGYKECIVYNKYYEDIDNTYDIRINKD